jgi:hypothetical protein
MQQGPLVHIVRCREQNPHRVQRHEIIGLYARQAARAPRARMQPCRCSGVHVVQIQLRVGCSAPTRGEPEVRQAMRRQSAGAGACQPQRSRLNSNCSACFFADVEAAAQRAQIEAGHAGERLFGFAGAARQHVLVCLFGYNPSPGQFIELYTSQEFIRNTPGLGFKVLNTQPLPRAAVTISHLVLDVPPKNLPPSSLNTRR